MKSINLLLLSGQGGIVRGVEGVDHCAYLQKDW